MSFNPNPTPYAHPTRAEGFRSLLRSGGYMPPATSRSYRDTPVGRLPSFMRPTVSAEMKGRSFRPVEASIDPLRRTAAQRRLVEALEEGGPPSPDPAEDLPDLPARDPAQEAVLGAIPDGGGGAPAPPLMPEPAAAPRPRADTPPNIRRLMRTVPWGPAPQDGERRAFATYLADGSEYPSGGPMNCQEGVCVDLISRGETTKAAVSQTLRDLEHTPGTGFYPSHLTRVLEQSRPGAQEQTVPFEAALNRKKIIPPNSIVFADADHPGHHVFITRHPAVGEARTRPPVRSLWYDPGARPGEEEGTGQFYREPLQSVLKRFQEGWEKRRAAALADVSRTTSTAAERMQAVKAYGLDRPLRLRFIPPVE